MYYGLKHEIIFFQPFEKSFDKGYFIKFLFTFKWLFW